jgi:Family of unknown function (DUF6232)
MHTESQNQCFGFSQQPPLPQRLTMAKEIVYLDTDEVKVTSSRLIIHGGTTYAMRQVTSVVRLTIEPDNTVAWQCIIWGVVLTMCCVGLVPLIIGAIMLANAKTKYALAVRTSGGEEKFLVGDEPAVIDDVVRAINKAIAGHG